MVLNWKLDSVTFPKVQVRSSMYWLDLGENKETSGIVFDNFICEKVEDLNDIKDAFEKENNDNWHT